MRCPAVKKPCKVIAFLTDFGYEDPYVAAMKGVTIDICPEAKVIDITHSVQSFDIDAAAFILFATYRYFPQGTIFVVVVDPGVGSERRPLLMVTRNYYFVGPDNGVLTAAAEDDGIEAVINLENDLRFRKPVSSSFHGRDIFAPVAASLACGVEPELFGSRQPIESIKRSTVGIYMSKISLNCAELRVIYIDKFGNVMLSQYYNSIANALSISMGEEVSVYSGEKVFRAAAKKVFSIAKEGELVLYENSFGLAELAVNRGSAKELLNVTRGHVVKICK
jgi:S-adenosylmethionine hydrolase|uniref:SAM-dependent chlorinase/fluorinase n=1 Tax=Ignisphaera aggregans TaxID=334771 RepID=A0A7J2U5U2_9CREN